MLYAGNYTLSANTTGTPTYLGGDLDQYNDWAVDLPGNFNYSPPIQLWTQTASESFSVL